jgi:hypothetical protein
MLNRPYTGYTPENKSRMRKGPRSAFDNWKISVVIQTQIFQSCQPCHGGILEVMTSPLPNGTLVAVQVCNWINTTGDTSGSGYTDPSAAPEFTQPFSETRVTRPLALYICFLNRCFSFCTFSFHFFKKYQKIPTRISKRK